MVTVSEIEAAIEKLPPAEYRELLAWIAEHQALIGASEALFAMYDDEEKSHGADASRSNVVGRPRICGEDAAGPDPQR
jgi:hypothetical protein